MSEKTWKDVDELLEGNLLSTKESDRRLIEKASNSGLPGINVTPLHGAMLTILVKSIRAKRALEIGTLGGFSSTCIMRGMDDDGKVISLEVDAKHKAVAERNLREIDLDKRVEIRLGPALETLSKMKEEKELFDFVFIDADKSNNRNYLELALGMCHKGSLIYVDNVVQEGRILEANEHSDSQGNMEMIQYIKNNSKLISTCIQTVGEKGHDGFLLAYVL